MAHSVVGGTHIEGGGGHLMLGDTLWFGKLVFLCVNIMNCGRTHLV